MTSPEVVTEGRFEFLDCAAKDELLRIENRPHVLIDRTAHPRMLAGEIQ